MSGVVVVRAYTIMGAVACEISADEAVDGGPEFRLVYRSLTSAQLDDAEDTPELLEVLGEALFEAAKALRYESQVGAQK